jgi:pSer/pThr/pTyr-binding forkhead associated (FHA) protein
MSGGIKDREASALVLLDENAAEIKSWDLHGRTGLVIGRGGADAKVDIDLSGTEYYPLISAEHAVLNYAEGCWLLADAGSKNGTALSRGKSEQKLLLASGEPVPIKPGDRIYIAEETILAVR